MTQVALSATLLIAAVILSRSLLYASRSDVGFRPDGLVLASFNVDLPGYDAVRAGTFYDALLERVRRLPGVQRAALADFVPMGDRGSSVELTSPDAASIDTRQGLRAAYNRVSDEYLATIGQPVLRGREFTDRDREPAPPVAIVNETLARRYWPDGSAIGKHIQVEGEAATREVVGIAANARYASFGGEVGPFVLLPARQRSGFQLTLHLRAASTAPPVLSDVVRLAREIDPAVALQKGTTMREAMGFSLLPAQVARTVFAVAGLVGLALASCGLFGLVSYTCEQRLKEIGVMVALGASRKRVLGAVVGGTFMFVFSGLAAGTVLAAAAMHVFRALLYGVTSWDLTTMAGVVMVLAGVALASSVAAARKGLNVDPVVALRHH
jgi:predicted permease